MIIFSQVVCLLIHSLISQKQLIENQNIKGVWMILLVGKLEPKSLKEIWNVFSPPITLRKEKLEQDKLTFKLKMCLFRTILTESEHIFGRFECNCLKLLHSERIWNIKKNNRKISHSAAGFIWKLCSFRIYFTALKCTSCMKNIIHPSFLECGKYFSSLFHFLSVCKFSAFPSKKGKLKNF